MDINPEIEYLTVFIQLHIIFITDFGWWFKHSCDKNEWRRIIKAMHVLLFIKLPFQKRSIEIDTKFETCHLGNFINRWPDDDFDLEEAERLLREENSFRPFPREEETSKEPGK